jgi:hypothetical protein
VSKGALQVELSVTGNVTHDWNIHNSNQFLLIIGYQQITSLGSLQVRYLVTG